MIDANENKFDPDEIIYLKKDILISFLIFFKLPSQIQFQYMIKHKDWIQYDNRRDRVQV